MNFPSPETEAMALIESRGGHAILLDALCNTTRRYLEENPHVDFNDLRCTFDIFHRIVTALANETSS
jgi:hypothetical protein